MEQIKVRLMEELQTPVAFTIPLFGGIPVTLSVVVSWLVMGALILAAALLTGLGWFDKLAKRAGVEMPITQAAYQVLYEGRDPKTVLQELMRREKRHEMEETWI